MTHKVGFYDEDYGMMFLKTGKYDTEEDESEIYFIGIFTDDDYELQFDSLSEKHVEDTFDTVSKFVNRKNFIDYFKSYCTENYLVSQ